jgi:formylglycine-generating enzyme required for sulfatase activity
MSKRSIKKGRADRGGAPPPRAGDQARALPPRSTDAPAPAARPAKRPPSRPKKRPPIVPIALGAAVFGALATAAIMSRQDEAGPGAASTAAAGSPCPAGMARVPGGTFTMGAADGDPDQAPPHAETVRAFCLDLTEVTVEAFGACVRSGRCSAEHLGEWSGDGEHFAPNKSCNYPLEGHGKHPINCVDFKAAETYCRTRGARLPTEPEWEWAARGGDDGRTFPWGFAPPVDQACWRLAGDEPGSKRLGTCEVGTRPVGDGRFGHHDLAGNLWEWTSSHYCPYAHGDCDDGAFVTRGGSWVNDSEQSLRVTKRSRDVPTNRLIYVGFRCARD